MSKECGDALGQIAAGRGMSKAATLDRLVSQAWWAWAMESEREARRIDEANPEVVAERELWEQAHAEIMD
jgi:hypothetical protein